MGLLGAALQRLRPWFADLHRPALQAVPRRAFVLRDLLAEPELRVINSQTYSY
jgi:hypothetical protein